MLIQGLFDPNFALLGKTLDLRVQKHTLITSNIAHQDTPGYIAKDFPFYRVLKAAIQTQNHGGLMRTNPKHITVQSLGGSAQGPQLISNPVSSLSLDGNTVNIEREMASLANNTMEFNAAAQIIAKKYSGLKNTIRGGG